MDNYIEEACKTVSPHFYGTKVTLRQLADCMAMFIEAGREFDAIKKALFYGKDSEAIDIAEATDLTCNALLLGVDNPQQFIDILHGIAGIATEATEMVEAMQQAFQAEGVPTFDGINLVEEGGDSLWYHALLFRAIGTDFPEVMRVNIEKLQRKRYKNAQFTAAAAINRDVAAERALLEAESKSTEDTTFAPLGAFDPLPYPTKIEDLNNPE